ncbi:MAG: holo-ACP synthase [Verrucomicrobia bacterium]|nr:holo-ACP synthase [Verrucomicrobiota bacterium]
MTVFGIGIDVVENGRIAEAIQRHGERFLERIYQPGEMEYCRSMRDPHPHFAARFAAKEAVSKALGTGFAGQVTWRDIEIRRKASGEPFVVLHAGAAALAKRLGIHTVLVSLSHSQAYAVAHALLIKD